MLVFWSIYSFGMCKETEHKQLAQAKDEFELKTLNLELITGKASTETLPYLPATHQTIFVLKRNDFCIGSFTKRIRNSCLQVKTG